MSLRIGNPHLRRLQIVGRARWHGAITHLRRKSNAARFQKCQSSSRPILFIYHSDGPGLGALYLHALMVFELGESLGVPVSISIPKSVYSRGGDFDVISDLWDNRNNKAEKATAVVFRDFNELPINSGLTSVQSAHSLWTKNLALKHSISKKVEEEMRVLNLVPGEFVAVHYRSSDKVSEALPPSFEEALIRCHHWKELGRKIYVATDDPQFADAARSALGAAAAIPQHERAAGTTAVHHRTDVGGKSNAEEALLTMLCLSQAEVLIKSPSALSAMAVVISPHIVVEPIGHLLPRTSTWFPDSLFFKERVLES